MPIYEYRCPDCQKEFEEYRLLADRDHTLPCPQCGSCRPERMLSRFSSCSNESTSSTSSCSSGGFT